MIINTRIIPFLSQGGTVEGGTVESEFSASGREAAVSLILGGLLLIAFARLDAFSAATDEPRAYNTTILT